MNQWITLFYKELVEMWRNFKWIWVPLTFILLGVKEPLSSYYLPQIIDSLGGLPKGAIIKIPTPTAAEVLVKGLSQYTSLGVLIIVLITMGLLAGERKNGVAAMILVKPVSYPFFVTAKWAGSMFLMLTSFLAGYLATWYYTGILFAWIPIADFFQSFLYYILWFILVITITVFFSASFLNPGMAGFSSIAIVIVVNIISDSLTERLAWSPVQLINYANKFLVTGNISDAIFPTILIDLSLVMILLILSILIFRRKELTS